MDCFFIYQLTGYLLASSRLPTRCGAFNRQVSIRRYSRMALPPDARTSRTGSVLLNKGPVLLLGLKKLIKRFSILFKHFPVLARIICKASVGQLHALPRLPHNSYWLTAEFHSNTPPVFEG